MNYFIAMFLLFLVSTQVANASEPDGSPNSSSNSGDKGSEVVLRNHSSEDGGNLDSLDSVLKSVNDMKTEEIFDDESSLGKLKLNCEVTPAMDGVYVPKQPFNKSNNLMRKPGSAVKARGEYLLIKGKVMDEDCLPISDAVIQIWQTDTAGGYFNSYETRSEWELKSASYDKNFAYSGSAQTNNLGEYSFVTIFPNSIDNGSAPRINFIIKHQDFKEIKTMMYFNQHPKNDYDTFLKEVPPERRNLLLPASRPVDPTGQIEGREYNFNITLEGINKFRRY